MALRVEDLWQMPDLDLVAAYYDARRGFAEKKFVRDSQRARLEWQRAKVYLAAEGRSISDRNNIVEAHEELGRKGQELREMTRDLDLVKIDVDIIAMVIRLRGGSAPTGAPSDGSGDGEPEHEG